MTTVPTSPLPPPEGSGSRRPVTPPPPSPPRASRRPATPPARSASPTFSTPPPSPPPPPPPPLMDRGSPSRGRGDEAYFPRNRPRSPSPNRGGGNRSRTPSPATSDAGRNDNDLDVDDDDDKTMSSSLAASGSTVLLRDWDDRSPKNTTATTTKKNTMPNLDKPKSTTSSSSTNTTGTTTTTTTTTTSKLKQPGKKKSKSKIRRSLSGLSNHSSHHKNDKNNLSSLFHVTFPEKQDELEQVQEFERIDASLKNELWYFAKELRQLMAVEVDRNRRYEEGELEEDEVALLNNSNFDEEEICCWRGLEHVLEGDDRVARIRTTLEGIVNWYQEAREMGYHDPEELRVVCKARTKSDRNRAQKRATADAQYLKKMYKQHAAAANANGTSSSSNPTNPSTSSSSSSSTKKFVRRISKSFSPPKLNWSPKPSKKGKAQATASA